MATVLVVDDDPAILEVLGAYLRAEGHAVLTAADGPGALARIGRADLAVLDWMLPGVSGLEVLARVRETRPDLPVLLLTARGEEADKLRGLGRGADDYVVKPFSPRELVARVAALLRRAGLREVIDLGPLHLDLPARLVRLHGAELPLSRLEFELLATLARHPGLAWTRERLLERVWGPEYPGVDRVVDVHITALRRKLGDDPEAPRYIETLRGVGYRFRAGA